MKIELFLSSLKKRFSDMPEFEPDESYFFNIAQWARIYRKKDLTLAETDWIESFIYRFEEKVFPIYFEIEEENDKANNKSFMDLLGDL